MTTRVMNLREAITLATRSHIARALDCSRGNVQEAAKMLGVNRPNLYLKAIRSGLRIRGGFAHRDYTAEMHNE